MTTIGLIGPIGPLELLIILFIVVLLFGAKRIPDLARGLGEGIRNFRSGIRGDEGEGDGKNTDGQLHDGTGK